MRRYELMLLLRPDLDDEHLQGAVERVTRAIVNAGGSLSKVSPWGKRRLAYEINHQRDASYFLIHFEIEPGAIREIERGMQISEEILRHMLTILEDRPTGRTDGDGARSRTGAPRAETADDAGDAGDAEGDVPDAGDVDVADAPEAPDAPDAPDDVPDEVAAADTTEQDGADRQADAPEADAPEAEPAAADADAAAAEEPEAAPARDES